MKPAKFLIMVLVIALASSSAVAHEGMIALYADETASACQVNLPELQIINLSLFYIRGNGPRFGNACEFDLLKSTEGTMIGEIIFPPSHGLVLVLGNLGDGGVTIGYHAGEKEW